MFEAILRRGILTTIATLIVCVLGILAAIRIPVQMIPDLEVRTITVRTIWPGATPQDVEKEIVIEQEEYLRTVPNLRRMISQASTGEATIELEFPFGVDINEALIRVNNALSQVPDYPENVDEPRLFASSFSDNAFMFYRVSPLEGNPAGLDMDMMRDFIDDTVRTRMERVEGVSQVEVWGGADRQVQIHIDPALLAERSITLSDVRNAIRARNRDISGGDIESGKRRYLLRTVGRFRDVEDLEGLIIDRRGDAITRLGEVASVRLDHFELRSLARVDGQPVIALAVRRETGSNVIAIKDAMQPVVKAIDQELLRPEGMQLRPISDDVRYVEDSVANVWTNLAIGAALATAVMFIFLRSASTTLVGVMGVPICTIAAFLGLLLAGRTINVISLAGVAFAIGMTLDNTIVVLESIERERAAGRSRLDAALAGVRRVWPAVLASTLTTVLVFTPVLFIEEEAGQLYSDIAVAISAAILTSMLVAITVVPTAASHLALRTTATNHTQGRGADLKQRILAGIGWLLDTRPRRLGCIALTLLITGLALKLLTPPAEYLPEGEEAKTFSIMMAPTGYNLTAMTEISEQVLDHFIPYIDADPQDFANGDSPVPALAYFNMQVQAQQIRVIAETVDPSQIDALMRILGEHFEQYPGMRSFSSRGSIISSNDGGTRSVNLDISGAELGAVYQVALAAYRRAEEVFDNPQVRPNPPTLALAQPLLEVHPNWDRAAELGLDAGSLGFTVAALNDGAYVDEFFLGDDKIDIFLYGTKPDRQRELQEIAHLPLHTPEGNVLPLNAVAELVERSDTDVIRRVDGGRTVTLNIIPPRSVALETAVEVVEKDVVEYLRESGEVASGVSLDISGASDQLHATREALTGNFIVALVLCYLLMVAIFSHWGYPLVIMTAVPLGITGGIIGLALMNGIGALLPLLGLKALSQPFDMITMLGFLILLGTVVNNPILIVDQARYNLREHGMAIGDAVREAVALRLRPITMSTITTICGLAPLVFIPGAGTELYRGVGAIVLFGLLFATIVTLTFLPSLLMTIFEIGERWRQRHTR